MSAQIFALKRVDGSIWEGGREGGRGGGGCRGRVIGFRKRNSHHFESGCDGRVLTLCVGFSYYLVVFGDVSLSVSGPLCFISSVMSSVQGTDGTPRLLVKDTRF